MSYKGKPIFFLDSIRSTPQIKSAMISFLEKVWLSKHSYSNELILFHYTNLEGLKGILNSRSFWCTHSSTLNDPSELEYGKILILSILEDFKSKESDSIVDQFLHNLISNFSAFNIFSYNAYIASFCELDNLLSQWRIYASQGNGYSIGIRFKTDTKFFHDLNDNEEESYVILRKMIYNLEEQKELVIDFISSIISSVKDAIIWFNKHGGLSEAWEAVAATEAVNILFDLMLSFKNPAFSEEKEWRLIKVMQSNFKPHLIKFRENKEQLIPYISTYITEENNSKIIFPITSIRIGPMLDEKSSKSILEVFLNNQASINHKIKINPNIINIKVSGYFLR